MIGFCLVIRRIGRILMIRIGAMGLMTARNPKIACNMNTRRCKIGGGRDCGRSRTTMTSSAISKITEKSMKKGGIYLERRGLGT